MGHDPDEGHDHGHGGHHHGHSHAALEHKAHAPTRVACAIVTCSDSRDAAKDETGQIIADMLEAVGHSVVGRKVVKDEPAEIRAALEAAVGDGARAVVFNGGTGVGRRDCTVEVLAPLFEKPLPGFGELFRYLSFKEIGSPAMMSRAAAGTYRGAIVFALPGSPQGARLAMDALILPELGHLVRELSR